MLCATFNMVVLLDTIKPVHITIHRDSLWYKNVQYLSSLITTSISAAITNFSLSCNFGNLAVKTWMNLNFKPSLREITKNSLSPNTVLYQKRKHNFIMINVTLMDPVFISLFIYWFDTHFQHSFSYSWNPLSWYWRNPSKISRYLEVGHRF